MSVANTGFAGTSFNQCLFPVLVDETLLPPIPNLLSPSITFSAPVSLLNVDDCVILALSRETRSEPLNNRISASVRTLLDPEVLQKIPEDLVFVQEETKSREPITVQRVVISRNSSGSNKVLTLAEIRLFNGSERVSLDKAKITQSSTFNKDTGAEKVIDGLNKFGIGGKSVSSTKTGNKHWLKLVPAKPVLATDIKIFTNIDASNQYTGVTMKVFGLNNLLILEQAISKNKVQTYSLVD